MIFISYVVASTIRWSTEQAVERAAQLGNEVRNGWLLAYSDRDISL